MNSILRKALAPLTLAAALVSAPIQADHWHQTADPQVVHALNTLSGTFAQACQMGSQPHCAAYQDFSRQGQMMLNAGYECQMNRTQEACWFYQQQYASLSQMWSMYQQNQTRNYASGNPMAGMNHAQRQQFLQNNFNNIMAQGRRNSALLDQRHKIWMDAQ